MGKYLRKSMSAVVMLLVCIPLIISAVQVKAYGPIIRYSKDGLGYIQEIIPGKYLMHLQGSPYAMGYQQGYLDGYSVDRLASLDWFRNVVLGMLSADEATLTDIMMDVMDYNRLVDVVGSVVSTANLNTVKSVSGDNLETLLQKMFVLCGWLVAVNEVYVPAEYIQEMHGVADGATAAGYGVTYEEVRLLNMGMDSMLALAYPVVEPLLFWMNLFEYLSCSGFVAKGAGTVSGHTIMGRHWQFTDYVTHEEMMMMEYVPTSGYRFMSTSCPGFVGVTSGMNNQGIGIGNDMVPAGDCDPAITGMGTLLLCRYVMQYKGQLTDAINFIKSAVRGCSWIYGIGDGKNGEVGGCALETSDSYCYTRSMSYTHPWYAIFYTDQIEKKSELVTYCNHYIYYQMNTKADSTVINDSKWRYQTLTNLALGIYGAINIETGATLIDYLHPPNYGYYGTDPTREVGCAITCWDLTTLQAKALYGHYNDAWVYTSL
jgi:hypothetical protein